MPIYRLTPINLDHRDWQASTHKGPCIVRAETENLAGLVAKNAFSMAAGRSPGQTLILCPWNQPDKVKITHLTDHEFDEEGPQVVLDPPGHHRPLD